MTWCGKDPGDTQDCGIQVSWRQDTSEEQESKPGPKGAVWREGGRGPKGACVERGGPGQGPELVGRGHRSCRPKIRLTAQRSQEDSKGGKLRMVGVAFGSLSCSSASPSPPVRTY